MIKAIFFDFDGVLTTDADGIITHAQKICELFPNVIFKNALDSFFNFPKNIDTDSCSQEEIWNHVCTELGIELTEEMKIEILRSVPLNEQMLKLAKSLSSRYTVGIITDNGKDRVDVLTKELKLASIFNPIIVSASVHATKHDGSTTIFDAAITAANCKPEETIFIDNRQRNLVAPSAMGIHTYWHDDAKNDMQALREALSKWNVETSKL